MVVSCTGSLSNVSAYLWGIVDRDGFGKSYGTIEGRCNWALLPHQGVH